MKLKITILIVLMCCGLTGLHAQNSCLLTEDNLREQYAQNPRLKAQHDRLNKSAKIKERAAKMGFASRSATSWEIPVVVHVLGETQWGKSVTYEKVKNAIDIVNENFQGLNADFNTVDPAFDAVKSSISVTFKLAKIDPQGGSTSGVLFYEEEVGLGLNTTFYQNKVKEYSWDNYRYMNLFILADLKNDENSSNSGVAWYPSTWDSDQGIARAVMNGSMIHDNYHHQEFAQLTHEFGHWLNLIHTFNGGCDDPNGDHVDDTPKEDSNSGDKGCTVGATECGNLINYENYMGYDAATGCSKMFTAGQVARMEAALEDPTREPLWQATNLTATGVNATKGVIAMKYGEVVESRANDGTITDRDYEITITGSTFSMNSGTMSSGTHFTTDLPAGVNASITVVNNTKVNVKFSGQVANHGRADIIKAKSITFTNAAITGGTTSVNASKVSFNFRFFDPYYIKHVDPFTQEVNTTAAWQTFPLYAGLYYNKRGIFYENGGFYFETFGTDLVLDGNTRNVTFLQEDELISDASNWKTGQSHPNLPKVYADDYTVWKGKTGYIGFQVTAYPGEVNYGWLKVEITADASAMKILAYGINLEPNGPIRAGKSTLVTTPDPTCTDGIQNGDETGVDCGGSSCNPCQTSAAYCDASNAGTGLNITNVSFGQIDHSSSGDNNYVDNTSVTTTADKGSTVALTVGINNYSWSGNAVGVWIDWNNDKDFEDAGEKVLSKYGSGPYNTNVTIPATAETANVRMRVRIGYGSEDKITPCGADTYLGEVEDYIVNIGGSAPTPTCNDGIQNGDETGVDCGGTSCAACQVEPNCNDGIQNGDETGVDCGGSSCNPCQTSTSYCVAGNQGSNYIATVNFGTISHSSQNSAYTDNTSISTNVTKGESITLTVNSGNDSWGSNVIGGWIDWNQNGDFGDAGEEVLMKPKGSGAGIATVVIPNTALEGTTRLRVRYRWWSNPSPCGATEGDEVEDYSVVVSGGSTPTPTCTDGIQNGDETGVDCGGSSCSPCQATPTCTDGIQNGDETGVDCGGTSCTPCATSGTVVYQDIFENNVDDIALSNTATWNFFRIEVGDDNGFGAWYSGGLRLVNYGKDMITEGTTSNVTMLGEGVVVGPSSNFTSNSNSFMVSSSSYTAWNGNSGYLGFSFKISGNTHYGWMYVTVAADGLSYTILDYAYNSTAGEGLTTTRSTGKSASIDSNLSGYPNPFEKFVNIDVSNIDGDNLNITVYDITGKVLLERNYGTNPGQIVINDEIKNSGSYFVKVATNRTTQTLRLVKK
ncbi:M43 family zinc metalloprotease [Aquimarina sp. 2201CG1-2-11]|uniref:zinc-dependent metalloprotease n=1 Tax=Aquimarina discodermiae TaxID=3231043 RepID=UPI003461A2EA